MKASLPILLVVRTAGGEVPTLLEHDCQATDIEPVAMFHSLPKGRTYRTAIIAVGHDALSGEDRARMRQWVDSVVRAHIPAGRSPIWL